MPHLAPSPFNGVRFRIVLESMDTSVASKLLERCLDGYSFESREPINVDGVVVTTCSINMIDFHEFTKATMARFRLAVLLPEFAKEIDFNSFNIEDISEIDHSLDAPLFYTEALRSIFYSASMRLLLCAARETNKALSSEVVKLKSLVSALATKQKQSDEVATYAFYSREAVQQTLEVISERIVSLGGEELGPLSFNTQAH